MSGSSSTRDDLVRAGVELLDQLPLERILAGVTTAAVAEQAGVTTGSFFHHFRNSSEYTAAVVRSFDRERRFERDAVSDLTDAIQHRRLSEAISAVLVTTWRILADDPQRQADRRGQMHLFAHHRAGLPPTDTDTTLSPTPPAPTETVGDVLRDIYRSQVDQITATWQRLLSLGEMRLAEPFDTRRLAVAVHALLLGLEIVHAVDPDAVDDNLFAEATATLAAALSRLDLDPARVMTAVELGQTEATSPQARSGARRRLDTRRRIVAAATGMFASGWDHVSAKEIGTTAGVSTQTVINLFGNVRRVCAATFVRHLPAVEAALGSTGPDRPRAGIAAALGVIADAAAGDPHPARALLAERVGVRVERGFELDDDDIRVIVPIGIRIAQQITQVTDLDITSPHVPDLSSMVVDFTLGHAVPRPDSRDDTVRRAMALLDDALGALAIDSETPGVPHYSDDPSDLRHDAPDARGNGRLQ